MGIIISKLDFSQNIGKQDEWHLKDLNLGKLNLLVGRNAVGKTRTLNVISSFTKMISGKVPKLTDGNFKVSFQGGTAPRKYILEIQQGKVVKELLTERGETLLRRSGSEGAIWHLIEGQKEKHVFYPPEEKLTYQVRRDMKQLPYLEEMATWAEKFRIFRYSHIMPHELSIVAAPIGLTEDILVAENLSTVPHLLDRIQGQTSIRKEILKDLAEVGYATTELNVVSTLIHGAPAPVSLIQEKEDGVPFYIPQTAFSEGMYRTIAIVIVMNYLVAAGTGATVAIDDVGGGLDFERSTRLTKILFEKAEKSNIQLIATSNDRFLMNAVNLKYWNVLERQGTMVYSFNYRNSKRIFDRFMRLGLNNFDFFASELYKDKHNE